MAEQKYGKPYGGMNMKIKGTGEEDSYRYKCKFCDDKFRTKAVAKKHLYKYHEKDMLELI